jgi:hypothetical protein
VPLSILEPDPLVVYKKHFLKRMCHSCPHCRYVPSIWGLNTVGVGVGEVGEGASSAPVYCLFLLLKKVEGRSVKRQWCKAVINLMDL